MLPLSLYAHIPWCERKCPYCDFNSHVAKTAVQEPLYVDALLSDLDRDLDAYGSFIAERELQSIFIGGGTPSLFTVESIARVLEGINARLPFSHNIEITLEANPGSSERDRFKGYRDAGINRLSIGVQSFDDDQLVRLGRVHSAGQAIAAAEHANHLGFNVNLDLMYGLPNQALGDALTDITRAISLQPSHISSYQLTIEPNTLFHHSPPPRPNDESLWQMQLELQNILADAGYQQYEVSAYAKNGKHSQHNVNYWQYGDYIGIGAGAHAKLTNPESEIVRYWKIKHPATYQDRLLSDQSPIGSQTEVDDQTRAFEFMLNALRLTGGFRATLFEERTFLPLSHIEPILNQHINLGLIHQGNGHIQTTSRGSSMIDSMMQDYLPE